MKLTTSRAFKKAEAFSTLLDSYKNNKPLSESQMSMLINYFMPPLPRKVSTPFDYVAMAVGVGDIRGDLNLVQVQGGIARASDGHRLHWAYVPGMADGFYTTARVQVDMGDQALRDFSRVMPPDDAVPCTAVPTDFNVVICEIEVSKKVERIRCVVLPEFKPKTKADGTLEHHGVQLAYLSTAVASDVSAVYCVYGDNMTYVKCKYGSAVIMPMRL